MKLRFLILSLLCGSAWGTTYYVCGATGSPCNASDSNAGTSKSATWLHAPGMKNCSGNCSATTINAGDSIIFRGGDTWHWGPSGNAPYVGTCTLTSNSCWNFTASGTVANCQLSPSAGAIVTTSCIYIGVDQTWFSGGSWVRPQFNGDNPLSTSSPASCLYEDSSYAAIYFRGNYLIIDNLEFLGYCWNVVAPFNAVVNIGANDEIKNSYWHGWTMGTKATGCGSCDSDEYWALGPFSPGSLSTYRRIDHNVFDGSDSTYGNLAPASGNATGGIWLTPAEYDHNVINHASNGAKYYIFRWVHDNIFENISEPVVGGTHGNIVEWAPTNYTVSTYYYNNLTFSTFSGETVDMYPGSSSSSKHAYIFNNIMWGVGNGGNCYMIEGDGTGGPGTTLHFNNTQDNTCAIRSLRGSSTGVFQNDQFINFSPSGVIGDFSTMTTNTDNGNEIWQTAAATCGSASTNYAPTSSGCATVGAGANLTSTCTGMDDTPATTACENGIGGITYNSTNHTANDATGTARPSSGAWDSGAYQFSSGAVVTITNPTQGCTQPCVITGGTNGTVYAGFTFTQVNGTTCTWSVTSGSFQSGLSLSSGGVLSGTPTQTSTVTPTVQVSCSVGGNASVQVSLTVGSAGTTTPITVPTKIILLEGGSR